MRTIFLIFFLSSSMLLIAQINPTKDSTKYTDPQNMDVVYSAEAKCELSDSAMYSVIYKGINYSAEAKKANINDNVMVSFDVNFDNKIQEVTIIHKVGYGIDEQIVEVVKTLPFKAAVMNGIPVRQNVMMTIPIRTYPEM